VLDTCFKGNFFIHKFIFAVILALVFIFPCRADMTREIMEFSGASELEKLVPESVTEQGFEGVSPNNLGEQNIFENIASFFISGIKKELKGFASLCAFIVLCAFLRLNGRFFTQSTTVTDYVCILCISGYLYVFVADTLNYVTRAVHEMDTFMSAMLPVMTTLYTVSGNAASALSQSAGIYTALTLFEKINAAFLTPLFGFLFGLSIMCRISSVDLSGVVKFIKNFIIRTCITVMTLFISVLFFQSTLSGAADTLAMRGAKYAVSLVPIIGALVGEATRTVAASIGVIKTSAGAFAAVAVLYTSLIPAAALIIKKTILSMCAVAGRIMGAVAEAELIEDINAVMSILLALVLSVGVFFILAVTIFVKTAVAV